MAAGVATAAHVWVDTGASLATRGLVEIEADQRSGPATPSALVVAGTIVQVVVGAGANGTVGLSQARKGDCPEF